MAVLERILARATGAAVAAVVLAPALATAADQPTLAGTFNDWAAYSYKGANGLVCYIVSQPKKSDPKVSKRDPVFFLVTHRPGDKVRNEVNTIIGYPFKKDSVAKLTIDNTDFSLFTKGDGAWSDSKDAAIVAAMKKGHSMSIKGSSQRGASTTDTYSLAGVQAAMDKIDSLCK
ncbi:MAG: invasion associated locus B family protein [Hyphomicrobiales bacterium]